MAAPPEIIDLVERFERNLEAYRSGQYKEAQLRQEFLDPFFKLLGWDVDNTQGFAEAYKDVIHEDSIRMGGGGTEAPDYCFRIGGTRKFFVEAKKPSVFVKMEIAPAFQLRRYAWSAKLPLSVLTDFEEFAVYDTRIRPDKADKASTARLFYCTFREYAEKWDWIAGIFSRESILKGSFDKFAHAAKGKRGTAEVDKAFLAEIEGWRDVLARHIASNNPRLSQRDLNFAVQRTIDRIIFLRICEDRGIEPYGQLQKLLDGGSVYEGLCHLFHLADDRYNSGIFHFNRERERAEEPDDLTPGLLIEDKPLKDMVRSLYYPDSPYEFSVFTADILGQIYEQFLGKVIRLTPSHRAIVEEKPEVKKAGGVYYTPTYIVDYIVQNTVGTLLEGKTPKEASDLKVLDPACGSGSFLIGAYQYLLDWHRNWYVADGPEKWATGRSPALYQAATRNSGSPSTPGNGGNGGEWRLTTPEKRRILLNNIFGVDIDSQAVEVTKLSLLLKVLEGENAETLAKQLTLYRERALPDLGLNIKCGNSLIGPDFYAGKQTSLFDEEEQYRINAFDWRREFPNIMKGGGFDAVIGNPPYIRIQTMKEWAPIEVEHLKEAYQSARKGNYDIYVVFVEKGLGLLNPEGRLGFILPHKFFNAKYGEGLRRVLSGGRHLSEIVHFGDQQVFAGATNYTCLLFLGKKAGQRFSVEKVADLKAWIESKESVKGRFKASEVSEAEWNFSVGNGKKLLEKLAKMPVKLSDVAQRIFQGPITSADPIFLFKEFHSSKYVTRVFSQQINEWVRIESKLLKRVVRSGSIWRYRAETTALVLFPYVLTGAKARILLPTEMETSYPRAWEYLNRNKRALRDREKGKFRDAEWYRFGRTQNLAMWEQPKLLIPYMVTELAAYLDHAEHYYFINVTTGGYGIVADNSFGSLEYLCGLLNSRLLDFALKRLSTTFHGGYFAANKQFIEKLPIRPIDFSDKKDKARHDRMVDLVERMLDLHKKLPEAKTDHSKILIQRQIEATDHEIDALVYELYDLSEEEIKMVEEGDSPC